MNVLLLSFDKKILDDSSESYERMSRYATDVSMLGIIVLSKCGKETLNHGPFIATGFTGNPLTRLYKAYRTLKKWRAQYDVHIISSQEPFESGLIGWLVARGTPTKLEVQLHGDFYGNNFWIKQSWFNRIRARIGRFVLKRADAIRVVSERIKNSLVDLGIEKEQITVVPVAAQSNPETTQHSPQSEFTVLVVSRLTEEKNVTLITRAMPYILGKIPHAQCMIIGDGPQKVEIMASAKSLGVGESVHLHGHQKELHHYYAHADVVVIPSHTEGWGRVAIEAMSYAKSIVMTDVGVAGEIIKHNHNGMVIANNDAGALAEAVIELYENPDKSSRLALQARRDFEQLATSQKTHQHMIHAWKQLVI